jgi:hypothetical protein
MATSYLDATGLARLWERIKGKFVVQVTGKGLSTNDLTDALVTKINGAVQSETGKGLFSGKYSDLTGSPTAVSSFTNDAGYQTASQVTSTVSEATKSLATTSYVDGKVSSVYRVKGTVDDKASLPTSGNSTGDVYNTTDTGMNYVWNGTEWDALGQIVDLSGYLLASDVSAITTATIDALA